MTERTPIFRNSAKFAVPDFWGFYAILAEVVESDLLSLGRVFFINCSDSNV
jgi:hypothetical protein